MTMTLEQIHTARPVTNTFHNIVQALSVKLDSAARYGLYADDAREDGMTDCATVFNELASQEGEQIDRLLGCLRQHVQDAR
jgi:rubrerythrin